MNNNNLNNSAPLTKDEASLILARHLSAIEEWASEIEDDVAESFERFESQFMVMMVINFIMLGGAIIVLMYIALSGGA